MDLAGTAPKPVAKPPPEIPLRGNGAIDETAMAWVLEQIGRVVGH